MSGAKRGSGYRKSIMKQAIDSFPLPKEEERIVRVHNVIGKHIEVVESSGENALCLLPQRFHRLIWIKRGDYLIVSAGDADQRLRFQVEHVLQKEQIKYIKGQKLWPHFLTDETPHPDSGIIEIQDDMLSGNPNHINTRRDRSPSTSSTSSDDESEKRDPVDIS